MQPTRKTEQLQVGDFTIDVVEFIPGFTMEFQVAEASHEKFRNMARFILSGSVEIKVVCPGFEDYIQIALPGDHISPRPRLDKNPYDKPVVATITAIEQVKYVCVKNNNRLLTQRIVDFENPITVNKNTLVVSSVEYSINGVVQAEGGFNVVNEGDVITAPINNRFCMFTAD